MTSGLMLARAGLAATGLGLLLFSLREELVQFPRVQALTVMGSVLLSLAAFC